ncbi:CoA-binding protein [Alkalicoccus chagannorensis]|uniref:CoA-binding protein n=1 Tax=Alkalicoccus chagannorensis TaxID=427072 RepID=UPI001FE135FF|nr:CoA-binding protein [Alkalicoccus chagannorensis]
MLTEQERKKVLEEAVHIAVVGCSDKPHRTSYQIAEALIASGYKVTPVNPNIEEVFGIKAAASIGDVNEPVDIVNVFRQSRHVAGLAEECLQTDIPVFWTQLGIRDLTAAEKLEREGKQVVMDYCIKVEHARLIGKKK